MAQGFSTEIYKSYTSAVAKLGTMMEDPHGGRYRFCLNGAVALAPARLVQAAAAPPAAHVSMTPLATPAGSYTIQVTLGALAVLANEYADGYAYINDGGADGTTEGYMFRIKSHPAAASGASLVLTLYEDCPVKIALTANSRVTMVHNRHYGTVIHPSPPTAPLVGVTRCAVPANAYYWAQTRGLCPVLTDGVLVATRTCQPSSAVDGAVSPSLMTEGTPNVEIVRFAGFVEAVNATTEESLIFIEIE